MKFKFLIILSLFCFVWAECNEGEVELWPNYYYGGCFDIATTTVINFGGYYAQINDTIPSEIGQLVNLERLDLSGAPGAGGLGLIGDIPAEIGDLQNLTYLNLSNNSFTGIPPEIGMLQNLTELHLTNSELSGSIPDEIGALSSITELHLSDNNLEGEIPWTIGDLDNLLYFYCSNNALSGEIPLTIGDMNELRWLILDNNQLEYEIPIEIEDLTDLRKLDLSNNNLEGEIPDLYNPILHRVLLQNNQLSGNLPMFHSSELVELNLSNNNLSGEIPFEWADLNIGIIVLSHNQLTGEIPENIWNNGEDWWGDFTFDASHNQLSGEIPEAVFLEVMYLDLSHNQLTGELTEEMFTDFDLDSYSCWVYPGRYYNISNNQLSGVLPDSICNISGCNFDVSNNELCGPYPDCAPSEYYSTWDWLDQDSQDISNCSESCNAGEVELWGTCYDIDATTELYLSSQGLEGEIPNELWQLTNLYVLDLADNNLSGEISPDIGNLSLLRSINLQNNNLSGSIPQELDDLVYTDQLYLQNNNLSGELPEGIFWNPWYYEEAYNDDTYVKFLWINLSNNLFTGELTEAMFDHSQWSYGGENDPYCYGWYPYQLDISDNELSGILPNNICQVDCVDFASLVGNQFCGPYPDPDCLYDGIIGEQDTTNCEEICDDDDEDGICNELDPCFGMNDIDGDGVPDDIDNDGICDDIDPCFGWENGYSQDDESGEWIIYSSDMDDDGWCDDADSCFGMNDMNGDGVPDDVDNDGICDDIDPCFGGDNMYYYDDESGELIIEQINDDGDYYCNDTDACFGENDIDGDGLLDNFDGDEICDDTDPCFGWDNFYYQDEESGEWIVDSNDEDEDGICDDVDPCFGFDNWIDEDGCITYSDIDEDGECDDVDLFNDDAYIPEEYSMSSAYPNPFNPATNFQYEIPEHSIVDIYIYDLNGRVVDQLVSSYHSPGVYNVLWNASNHASGMYILFMRSNDFIHSQKISLTK